MSDREGRFVLAVAPGEGTWFPEPTTPALVTKWADRFRAKEHDAWVDSKTQGVVIGIRPGERALLIEVDGGRAWYPMRTVDTPEEHDSWMELLAEMAGGA